MTSQSTAHRERRRQQAKEYLGNRCSIPSCTETSGLQFDHVVASTKVKEISQAIVAHWSWQRLVEELDKCQLLCGPHHSEKTRLNGEHAGGQNKIVDPEHGTWAMYTNHGCKCPKCREWRRKYRSNEVDARGRPRVLV